MALPWTEKPYVSSARRADIETLARRFLTLRDIAFDIARRYVDGDASMSDLACARADAEEARIRYESAKFGGV